MAHTDTNHKEGDEVDLPQLANAIRVLSMDAVERAQSGHPGMPMGMADVAATLYANFLKFDLFVFNNAVNELNLAPDI